MNTLKAEVAEFRSVKDLKGILASQGPCLSFYIGLSSAPPAQSAKANALEWKEMVRRIEPKMKRHGAQGRELLESLADWDAIVPDGKAGGNSLAVFRSPDQFRVAWVDETLPSRAVVGPRFYIRPLLLQATRHAVFYILALSQKNVRMLRCTTRSSEEVSLPPMVKTSFDEWMNTAKPDHTSSTMEVAGPSTGSMKGIISTTSTTEREDKGQFLAHFFGQIDRGVNEILRAKGEPVVLAGVDYELSIYRSVNTYPGLAQEAAQGAPNGLKAGEMHARALDAISQSYRQKVDEILAEYNHKAGGSASNRLKDIVTAAHDGRVLTLLVSDSLESTGVFDQATHTVRARETGTSEDEDLINDAAVQTILRGGQVYVVRNGRMPNGAPLAAVFRF
ncbi:MAG TPA: hypothetical protein VH601_25525 [Bryobacteraceae bacterium]|jgi:hypothetical protein